MVAWTPGPAGALSPRPAGTKPSAIALMVCHAKARAEIDQLLGQRVQVSATTWVNHRLSCSYQGTTGTMALSVKELSSWPQTIKYFRNLAHTMGKVAALPGLGQGAFVTSDGSVVARKDWKVLVVDTSRLSLPSSSTTNNVALAVTAAIMDCWNGD